MTINLKERDNSYAVDEFIAENKIRKLETIPYNNTSGAFIIKVEE